MNSHSGEKCVARVTCDNEADEELSICVLETLSDVTGRDPISENFHLDDLVDLEYLDSLGHYKPDQWFEIDFDWGGYRILVSNSSHIEVWCDAEMYAERRDDLLPASMRSNSDSSPDSSAKADAREPARQDRTRKSENRS
jgi:hypothetical protein